MSNELKQLVVDIQRVGEGPEVLFGELFDDDEVQQHYEGLAATLKAAKKREYYYGNRYGVHILNLLTMGYVQTKTSEA